MGGLTVCQGKWLRLWCTLERLPCAVLPGTWAKELGCLQLSYCLFSQGCELGCRTCMEPSCSPSKPNAGVWILSKKVSCGQEAVCCNLNCWASGKSQIQSSQTEPEYVQEPWGNLLLSHRTQLQKTSGVRGLVLIACFSCEFLDLIANFINFHPFLSLFSLFIT